MFGKWRRSEKVSGLRSLSSIHQARDGRGGQKCSGFNNRATTLFLFSITHTHRHTHTLGACSTACRHALRCVCVMQVCVCVQIYQMSAFWSLWLKEKSKHGRRDAYRRKISELMKSKQIEGNREKTCPPMDMGGHITQYTALENIQLLYISLVFIFSAEKRKKGRKMKQEEEGKWGWLKIYCRTQDRTEEESGKEDVPRK